MTVKFTENHEWIRVEGDTCVVGITEYAQEQLGDIVFVELPEVGTQVDRGTEAGVIESVKAASEIFAPVSGQVTEVNPALEDAPATVNSDAMGEGWVFKMRLGNADQLDSLMDAEAYEQYVEGLE